jgi:hypothetical protein
MRIPLNVKTLKFLLKRQIVQLIQDIKTTSTLFKRFVTEQRDGNFN